MLNESKKLQASGVPRPFPACFHQEPHRRLEDVVVDEVLVVRIVHPNTNPEKAHGN
jgi:hypothetical protein